MSTVVGGSVGLEVEACDVGITDGKLVGAIVDVDIDDCAFGGDNVGGLVGRVGVTTVGGWVAGATLGRAVGIGVVTVAVKQAHKPTKRTVRACQESQQARCQCLCGLHTTRHSAVHEVCDSATSTMNSVSNLRVRGKGEE